MDAVIARAEVAKTTAYRYFPTKEHLILAFLDRRERQWTMDWLRAEIEPLSCVPREKLTAIFDLFDRWFQQPDYEACSFIRALFESEPGEEIHKAAAEKIKNVREFIVELADQASLPRAQNLASAWLMLLQGAIISAYRGDMNAARDAKEAAVILLQNWR